ncbi:putative small VCP/p97-interacting protein [Helianthus annuus]|nr:putative small VCP/p97-interacting protein [Helianthus annuus]
MGCLDCFDGGLARQERLEEERKASQEARAKAAEAAEKRQFISESVILLNFINFYSSLVHK